MSYEPFGTYKNSCIVSDKPHFAHALIKTLPRIVRMPS